MKKWELIQWKERVKKKRMNTELEVHLTTIAEISAQLTT